MKRWLGVLCATILIFLVGTVTVNAATQVFYQIAVNDMLPPNQSEVTPIEVDGTMYIPHTIFDKGVTNTDLGVYASQSRTDSNYTVTVYSFNDLVKFDLNANTCTDREGNTVNMRAIIRNNRVYLPASAVCKYFGLNYALYATSYGNLMRITNGTEELEGYRFLVAASETMVHRYNEYLQGITSQPTTIPTVTATPTPTPTPTNQVVDEAEVEVFLAFDCGVGEGLGDILTLLENRNWHGVFFFTSEEIVQYDDEIRRIVATGNTVGIQTQGESWEAVQSELTLACDTLEVVARIRPHLVLYEGETLLEELVANDWICWQTNLDGRQTEGESTTALAYRVMQELGGKSQWGQVLLDDGLITAVAASSIFQQVANGNYIVQYPSEGSLH